MVAPLHTIEIDEHTAALVDRRASELGMTVAEFVAALVQRDELADIADLDRRWAAVEGGDATVSHDKVQRWLVTWGTPGFKPWPESR